MAYTEEEMSLLSDEERAAIADDQPDEGALRAIAEGGDEDGDDEAAQNAATVDADAVIAKEEAEAGDESEAVEVETLSEDESEEREAFLPKYRADPVEDYEEKIAALDKGFEEGELRLQEYNQQRDALVRSQLKAEIAAEQNAQVEEQLWRRQVDDFIDDHPEYKESKFRYSALHISVKDLANDDANSDKTGKWFLREAHRLVQAEFGGKQAVDEPPAKPIPKARKPDLSMVPKTLSHLPAAEITQTGDVDEFAHIDRLTGLELEMAVSKMSEAERERYRAA